MKIFIMLFLLFLSPLCYSQNPCPDLDSIQYAGSWYHTVQIGSQCWLKENLRVGKMISVEQEQKNNNIIEKYCVREDSDYCEKFGGNYQWNEAMQYSKKRVNVQGICPKGWHIPTAKEIDTLIRTVHNNAKALTAKFGGTNTSGFSVDGWGAIRMILDNGKGRFLWNNIFFGYFWSSTEMDTAHAYYFCLQRGGDDGEEPVGGARLISDDKNWGLPVRCVKD